MGYLFGTRYKDKTIRLLDLTDDPRAVADPWYTDDFETAYRDIKKGCEALLDRCSK